MAGSAAVDLAEALDFVHGDRKLFEDFAMMIHGLDAYEVQRRIEKHGSVAGAQDEAIAVWPEGICGIVTENFLPKRIDNRREAHRCTRVAGIGLLDRVDGKRADGVDGELRNIRLAHDRSLGAGEPDPGAN